MAAGDINDPLSNIPNIVLVDQSAATAAPGAGYGRLEVVNGVLGVRVGTGAWVALASLVAGLLTALTEKVTPADTDLVLLQDEADASALKKVQVQNLPGGGVGDGDIQPVGVRVNLATAFGANANSGWNGTGGKTGALFGAYLTNDPTAGIGNYASFEVYLVAGTWTITVAHDTDVNRGIVDVSLEGSSLGTFDGYAGNVARVLTTYTGVVVAASGLQTLRFEVTGKNGASADYFAYVSGVQFVRTA